MMSLTLWDMGEWNLYLSSLREEHSGKHDEHHRTQAKGAHLAEASNSVGNLNLSMNLGLW